MVSHSTIKSVRPQGLLLLMTTAHMVNDFYGLILPFLLPKLIIELQLSYFEAGILAFATTALSGALQPVLGYVADRYRLRKIIVLSGFLLFGVGALFIGLAPSYLFLLGACFVYGFGEGTFHAQSTNFVTRAFSQTRGRALGIHGIGGSLGSLIAPLAVTILVTELGWRSGLMTLMLPGIVMAIVLGVVLREPTTIVHTTAIQISQSLLLVALNFGLVLMVYRGFVTFLPTFLLAQGEQGISAALISTGVLLVGLVAQPLGGWLYDQRGGKAVFQWCAFITGLGLLLFVLAIDTKPLIILAIALFGIGTAATFPVALAIASQTALNQQVGLAVGLVFGLSGTLAAFAPPLIGLISDWFSMDIAFGSLLLLPVLSWILSSRLETSNK
ncbi:MAG: MFS transporter [Chloroflexota bacterium]